MAFTPTIQGRPAVADLDTDGHLEIIAGDTKGNIAAFRADGTELWARHVASPIVQVELFIGSACRTNKIVLLAAKL